ncbi:hypothetical protein VHEMI01769 [[Torrubiella] hemipterigena]|uniref:Uncharacterized protein n=1 Tax=[Torrubiella] hemipterigena TaxID=1531966 RepID=A0A0A1T6D3_9HYPO|nr:hypothetical protein VHEMI01769 [[Torrubiella] hemipterigena]
MHIDRVRNPDISESARTFNGQPYTMAPPINLKRAVVEQGTNSLWARLSRRSADCDPNDSCGHYMSTNATTIAIVLGTVIPVTVAAIVFFFLHRRNIRKVRQEDALHANMDLDFGDDPKKSKRRTLFGGGDKNAHRPGQLSMDMNLNSPYLLAPHVTQSGESIHNMAKNFHNEQDPYHTVGLYSAGGDAASINSRAKGGARSPNMPPPRTNSMPKSAGSSLPPSPGEKTDPFATPKVPHPVHQMPEGDVSELHLPVQPIVPEIGSVYPDEHHDHGGYNMPDIQSPPPVLAKDNHYEVPNSPQGTGRFDLPELPSHVNNEPGFFDQHGQTEPAELDQPGVGLGFQSPHELPLQDHQQYPPIHVDHMDDQMHPHPDAHLDNHQQYAEYDSYPQIQTSEYYDDIPQNPHMYEDDMTPYPMQQDALGVPPMQGKRLSVGLRPLPPHDVQESEDPEYRANRIRSFYKEYFEDGGNNQDYGDYGEYYEDGAYYDPDSNAFVMPYAEPVMRRAMTPPPGGHRGPPMRGPRGAPRGPGSVGGMSAPGGRGRPRAGSAFAGRRPLPKKRLPPPQALRTLPTPSKLQDDSFAIFNATDFAPPESFKDTAAGRSQSPFGESRPYKAVAAGASPLVTAFDELSALPSPHMLRKSNTFTNLDFAPPKKFKDAEAGGSDAGSIRSNKSGISARQLGAIRAGAGRVSRLPGDTVFTTASMGNQLKPQWGMRA